MSAKEMQFGVEVETEEISCEEGGCAGCNAVHRRMTGRKFVRFDAGGQRFTGELVKGSGKWEAIER